jgi:hypothetical protein
MHFGPEDEAVFEVGDVSLSFSGDSAAKGDTNKPRSLLGLV